MLNLKDDLYEIVGLLDYVRKEDGKRFTFKYWYIAVENGVVQGVEGYPQDRNIADQSLEQVKAFYDMLLEDKWVQHRYWLEEEFQVDFEEWVRLRYCKDKVDVCKWHEKPLQYEEEIEMALTTSETVPLAVERAANNARLTMREWPNCQGDPLEIGTRFFPKDKKLSFFWDCKNHGK